MKTEMRYTSQEEIKNAKRKNAKLFPIYKMFSWDLLFFYSIQYLFFTITKGIAPGDILKINAFYPLFIILLQMPAAICGDLLGRKKSIVLGNVIIMLYVIIIIFVPGGIGLFIGNFFYAFGYSLKGMQETNLLYDSTATRGGDGLYQKINLKGASGYYIIDGIASLTAGFLFVINGYLAISVCFVFTVISTILAMQLKDIYRNKLEENGIAKKVKEYKNDFKYSLKNIVQSKRLRALLIFMALFNAIISIMSTYKGNILTQLEVKPETFSIINAVLTLLAGIGVTFQDKLHKKFRNRTLTLLSILYMESMVLIGILLFAKTNAILPFVLILLAVRNITMSNYYVLSERYLKNFSTPKSRTRISFATEFFTNIIEAICLFLAGMVLSATDIKFATLSVGLVFLIMFILALDYMKTRVGLKPEEYQKADIELE